jgi:hypothetical protein
MTYSALSEGHYYMLFYERTALFSGFRDDMTKFVEQVGLYACDSVGVDFKHAP